MKSNYKPMHHAWILILCLLVGLTTFSANVHADGTVCFSSKWSEVRGRCKDGDIIHLIFGGPDNEGVELAIAYFCDLNRPIRSGILLKEDKAFLTCTAKIREGRVP